MNSFERVWRRLRGEPVDRPPNFDIFMAVAARYLGQPIRDFYLDYRVLCEANLALHRDFSVDVLSTMSDPYRERPIGEQRSNFQRTDCRRARCRFCNRCRTFTS